MQIDGVRYSYTVESKRDSRNTPSLFERLDADGSNVFTRTPNDIAAEGLPQGIRIRHVMFTMPFLIALLGDQQAASHAAKVSEFLSNTHYYSLDEPYVGSGYVRAASYEDWIDSYRSTGNPESSVLHRLIYAYHEDRKLFDEICHILGPNGLRLVDDIDVVSLEQPQRGDSEDLSARAELVYAVIFFPGSRQAGHGAGYLINDLSTGTKRLLRIVTYLLFDKRTLLLLEQPEDSVHFGLLQTLIEYVRAYSTLSQVVFTTHSCDALNALRPEEVRLVHADNGDTRVMRLSPDQLVLAKEFLAQQGPLADFIDSVVDE